MKQNYLLHYIKNSAELKMNNLKKQHFSSKPLNVIFNDHFEIMI